MEHFGQNHYKYVWGGKSEKKLASTVIQKKPPWTTSINANWPFYNGHHSPLTAVKIYRQILIMLCMQDGLRLSQKCSARNSVYKKHLQAVTSFKRGVTKYWLLRALKLLHMPQLLLYLFISINYTVTALTFVEHILFTSFFYFLNLNILKYIIPVIPQQFATVIFNVV